MAANEFPLVTDEILAALDKAFPEKVMRFSNMNGKDASTVAMLAAGLAGQQSVLDLLRRHHTRQQTPESDKS